MKKLLLMMALTVVMYPIGSSRAQLFPPNEAGVSLGAWHTIVRDVPTTAKWWELWGGKPMKIDGVDVMKFPGVFIFMAKGEPNGGSIDHFIDHIAFMTADPFALLKKLTDAGVRTDEINLATMRNPRFKPDAGITTPEFHLASTQRTWTYTYSPDGLRVEVETKEGPEWATPQEASQKNFMSTTSSDMIHMYFPDLTALRKSYRFYKEYFGGTSFPDANINLHIPGTKLNLATDSGRPEAHALPFKTGEAKIRAKGAPRPANRGSALDYIGFEVVGLPGFVKKLEAAGVKFDEPYSTTRHKGYASAMFTGPGGEVVELTEGLKKF